MTQPETPPQQKIPWAPVSAGLVILALVVGGIAFAGSSGDPNPARPQEETVVPSGAPALSGDDSKDERRGDSAPGSIE